MSPNSRQTLKHSVVPLDVINPVAIQADLDGKCEQSEFDESKKSFS